MGERAGLTPDQMESEILKTRADLGTTVKTIKQRLKPGHGRGADREGAWKEMREGTDAMNQTAAREAERGDSPFLRSIENNAVTKAIIRNPVPVALIGIGIGWLLLRRRTGSSGNEPERLERTPDYSSDMEWAGTRETADETMERAAAKVAHFADPLVEITSEFAAVARDQAEAMKDAYEWVLESKPLVLAAAIFVLGIFAGFAIPESRVESRWMGRAKTGLLEKAREMMRDTIRRMQDVVENVEQSAREQARKEGLKTE